MANWNDVVNYLNANYKCKQETSTMLSLLFGLAEGRSQLVYVELAGNDQVGEWGAISSAVASSTDVKKLATICREAKKMICGGVVIDGDFIMIRDTFPLANLDINELEAPLHAVLNTADYIERLVVGGDDH